MSSSTCGISILLSALFSLLLEATSQPFLNNIINRRASPNNCPPLVDGPLLEFASPIQLIETNTTSTFGCARTIECNVLSSPMESMILWYKNGELVEERAVKDITFGRNWKKWGGKMTSKLGIGEISHRICIDSYLNADTGDAVQVDWFKCQAKLRCAPSEVIESDSLMILKSGNDEEEKAKRRKPRALGLPGQAPLIKLITSSRMELAGNLIQIMCKSTGNPKPKIQWSILASEDGIETLRPVEEFPFILRLNNGDLLIDSKLTEMDQASLTFKCMAVNKFGEDSATSSLIILDQEN